MEWIDDGVIATWATQVIGVVKSAGCQHVQVGEDLQGRVLPRIDLAGHGRGDRE